MKTRVVITGFGVCSPAGSGAAVFWQNLCAGRSGIAPVTLFDASALPVRIGGEVKGLDVPRLKVQFTKAARESDRKIWLGLDALTQAITDAALPPDVLKQAALFVGVSLEIFFLDRIAVGEAGRVQPGPDNLPLQTPLDRLAHWGGEYHGFQGGRYTNCSACAAGAQTIGEAFRLVRDGSLPVAVAGAADSVLNPLGLGGFSLLGILSTENDTPERACRPFEATRQGTVLSEGAAFVVLESLEHARLRRAHIYAEILGYGTSLDAYRVTDPEPVGQGAGRSMSWAIRDAGLTPAGVDAINAHGTGTPKNDVAETLAIKAVLGEHAYRIPVTANKSMTGHMIAASGAVEAVASVLTLHTQRIPPTINLQRPDSKCDLDYVAEGCRAFHGRTVLSNSFGFGGQNATLIFGRAPET